MTTPIVQRFTHSACMQIPSLLLSLWLRCPENVTLGMRNDVPVMHTETDDWSERQKELNGSGITKNCKEWNYTENTCHQFATCSFTLYFPPFSSLHQIQSGLSFQFQLHFVYQVSNQCNQIVVRWIRNEFHLNSRSSGSNCFIRHPEQINMWSVVWCWVRRREGDKMMARKLRVRNWKTGGTLRHVPGKQLKAKSAVPSAYNTRQEPVDQPLEAVEWLSASENQCRGCLSLVSSGYCLI